MASRPVALEASCSYRNSLTSTVLWEGEPATPQDYRSFAYYTIYYDMSSYIYPSNSDSNRGNVAFYFTEFLLSLYPGSQVWTKQKKNVSLYKLWWQKTGLQKFPFPPIIKIIFPCIFQHESAQLTYCNGILTTSKF